MSVVPGIEKETPREEKLAGLLAQLTEQLRLGRQPDMASIVQQHPDMADDLRELWAVAQIADHFAGPANQKPPADERTMVRNAAAPSSVPRTFGNYELLEELG